MNYYSTHARANRYTRCSTVEELHDCLRSCFIESATTLNWMGGNLFGALMTVVFFDDSTSPGACCGSCVSITKGQLNLRQPVPVPFLLTCMSEFFIFCGFPHLSHLYSSIQSAGLFGLSANDQNRLEPTHFSPNKLPCD